jgi:pyridoxal phosphate-dependent aminotransferase EpsN
MSGHEQEFVAEAFASNWLSSVGPNLDAFEAEVDALLGHGVRTLAVSSGTAALHLVLRAVGVGPGDRVAVSTLTFAGSVWPILYLGASRSSSTARLASGNLDPASCELPGRRRARGTLPKALVVVHLYGQHADVDPIAAACREHGVILVEDAAESLGATTAAARRHDGRLRILSFNGNKIITTTGGGMVVTRDTGALARMRKWANQSREPAVEYVHAELGYNYRMSNVLAGIGRGSSRCSTSACRAPRRRFERYAGRWPAAGLRLQAEAPWGTHSRWLTVMYLDPRYTVTDARAS